MKLELTQEDIELHDFLCGIIGKSLEPPVEGVSDDDLFDIVEEAVIALWSVVPSLTMTGVSLPDALVRIQRLFDAGEVRLREGLGTA